MIGIGFDFFAQAADADVNTSRGDELFAAPDSGEEFLAGEDTTRVRSEVIEKPELEKTGGDGLFKAGDATGIEIDQQLVEFESLARFRGRLGAPEEKLHAGDEFARAEGFGDVIIGAGFEGGDEIGFATAGGEHDDGQAMEQSVLADFGENLKSGKARVQGIEEQKIGRRFL